MRPTATDVIVVGAVCDTDAMSPTDQNAWRWQVLSRLHELSQGSPNVGYLSDDVGNDLGLDRRDMKRTFLWLRDEGLAALAGAGPCVAITHVGIRAVEAGELESSGGWPVNVMYVEHMENSQVQQGTYQSRQASKRDSGG